jgi:hypothetical protein
MKINTAFVFPKADHFLMTDRPEEFNSALEKAILMLLRRTGKESGSGKERLIA